MKKVSFSMCIGWNFHFQYEITSTDLHMLAPVTQYVEQQNLQHILGVQRTLCNNHFDVNEFVVKRVTDKNINCIYY